MDDKTFGRILRRMRSDAGKTVPEAKHLTSLGYKAATQTIYKGGTCKSGLTVTRTGKTIYLNFDPPKN